jgi:hypothetical protein
MRFRPARAARIGSDGALPSRIGEEVGSGGALPSRIGEEVGSDGASPSRIGAEVGSDGALPSRRRCLAVARPPLTLATCG